MIKVVAHQLKESREESIEGGGGTRGDVSVEDLEDLEEVLLVLEC
jgi:hypothetical protein